MPRFEKINDAAYSFWEITLDGNSLTMTSGAIGSQGKTTTKRFLTKKRAQSHYDALIVSQQKKGYTQNSSVPQIAVSFVPVSNPELEAAITQSPDDLAAYAVLSDWLQEQGCPRGQLMSLQLNGKEEQAKVFIASRTQYFLGELAEHQLVHDAGYNNAQSSLRTTEQNLEWEKTHREAFLWRLGYIDRVRLSHDIYSDSVYQGKTAALLEQVLSHPSGQFVREFSFQSNGDPNEDDLQDLIDVLAQKAPATTQKITFGDNIDQISWHHTGNLDALWQRVPNLKILEIETGSFEVGNMIAPKLERALFITGGLSMSCGQSLAEAQLPAIRHLEIYYGDEGYGGDCSVEQVKGLLQRSDLKHLQFLGLKNSMFANDIANEIGNTPILQTLTTLDLSCGALTDEGLEALVRAKDSLAHLDCLNLSHSFLSEEAVNAAKAICKNVITTEQNDPWIYGDGEAHYYVSVAE